MHTERATHARVWDEFLVAACRQIPSIVTAGVLGTAIASGQSFILAAMLGPERFGTFVLLLATLDLVRSLLDPYVYEPMLRFAGEYDARDQGERAFGIVIIAAAVDAAFAVLFTLVVWIGSDLIASHVLKASIAPGLMMLYAVSALARPVTTACRVVFSIDERPDRAQWLDSAEAALRAALGIGAVMLGLELAAILGAYLIAAAVTASVGAWLAARVALRRWGSPSWGAVRAVIESDGRRFLRFGAVNNLNFLLSLPSKQLDSVVVGMTAGPAAVAFLKIGKALAASLGLLVSPLQTLTYPRLVSVRSSEPMALGVLVRSLAVRIGVPAGLLALAGAAVIPHVVVGLLGNGYGPAALPAALLFIAAATWLGTFWVRPALLTVDRVAILTTMTAVTSTVAVLSYVFVLPRFGLLGYAGAVCVIQVVAQLTGAWIALREVQLPYGTFSREPRDVLER